MKDSGRRGGEEGCHLHVHLVLFLGLVPALRLLLIEHLILKNKIIFQFDVALTFLHGSPPKDE